ncbi:MAG: D-alanyl-D-alanine carboxypeptidase/D-alanyl-D-alanine-endopeptidase [Ilumatobacteraceae bacterium]
MTTDRRAEPSSSARSRAYRRRRLFLAAALLSASLLLLSGCRAVLSWLAEDAAEPAAAAELLPDDAPIPAEECDPEDRTFGSSGEPVPADLRDNIDRLLMDPTVGLRQVSVSVWVDGWGEVASLDPDVALKPASNQKVLTAIGALELLDPDATLTTTLGATTRVEGGRIGGDLVLIGGGDPMLWDVGEHSLYAMATRLRDMGVTEVSGALLVDDGRYDARRMAAGWTDQQIPGDAAPISALTVAANRVGDTPDYLRDPATGNGQVLFRYLAEMGITVRGGVSNETAEIETELVTLHSPVIARLVDGMMRNSDNTTAELLLKEIGLQASGEGSTAAGLAASRDVVESWCVSLTGLDDDGSGLSYANARSAREWRLMLQGAQEQPWWPAFHDSLPVAGDPDGTLPNRLSGPATVDNLRAKTGTINVARGLSGTFTTAGGRAATFSVIINDPHDPEAAIPPTDELLETIAAHPG